MTIKLLHDQVMEEIPDLQRWSEIVNEIVRGQTILDQIFLENVLFSDEASFSNHWGVNKHNCHYYAQNNPHKIREEHFQRVYSTNAWCGILENKIIGPQFFRQRLNGEVYLNFLRNILPMLLDEVDLQRRQNMQLQQDGASPYFHRDLRHYLDSVFANKWIGRGSVSPSPSRSPDTTPLGYFLLGIVKDCVYQTSINSREDLEL